MDSRIAFACLYARASRIWLKSPRPYTRGTSIRSRLFSRICWLIQVEPRTRTCLTPAAVNSPRYPRPARRPVGIRHQHIGIAEALGYQSLDLRDFVGQLRRPQDVPVAVRVLALDDEAARQFLAPVLLPRSPKRAIASAVLGIEERLDGLAEDLPRDGPAELLETVPAKVVQVVHSVTANETGLPQPRGTTHRGQSVTGQAARRSPRVGSHYWGQHRDDMDRIFKAPFLRPERYRRTRRVVNSFSGVNPNLNCPLFHNLNCPPADP